MEAPGSSLRKMGRLPAPRTSDPADGREHPASAKGDPAPAMDDPAPAMDNPACAMDDPAPGMGHPVGFMDDPARNGGGRLRPNTAIPSGKTDPEAQKSLLIRLFDTVRKTSLRKAGKREFTGQIAPFFAFFPAFLPS